MHPEIGPPPLSNPARVGVYHRASTLDQDPQLARAELQAWAARQGGQLAMLEEETASGASNARPGLQRIIAAARRGQLDVVACWKLDRFGRSALDVLANIQALADAGVRFVCVSQGIDIKAGGDAMSRLMLTVLAAVAEFERDLIRERTRLGMAKAAAQGKHVGRPRRKLRGGILAGRAAGMSWAELARDAGVSPTTVRRRHAELLDAASRGR